MGIPTVSLGGLQVTRLLIGGNPFSGFSHQSVQRNEAMRAWYTDERIVETLFQAESLGLNACVCRGDDHIARVLATYWKQGGSMCWVAQTDSALGASSEAVAFCADHGAAACYLHGGVMDMLIAQRRYAEVHQFAESVRSHGLPLGIAGHMPEDFVWAEGNLDVDFYMVCYYNPSPRQHKAEHDPMASEQYTVEDRDARVAVLRTLSKPAVHYKVLAAGRTPPEEAFAYVARQMRSGDAVCVGVYTQDKPDMLAEDIDLLFGNLAAVGQ